MKDKYYTNVEPRLKEIEHMRQDGLTEKQISKELGIAYSTFRLYKNKFPAFSAALKKSKNLLVNNLKESLYKRAAGYDYTETAKTIKKRRLELASGIKTNDYIVDVKITETKKFVYSDILLIFALCNLDPENFKRKDKDDIFDVDRLVKFIDNIKKEKPAQVVEPEKEAEKETKKEDVNNG